MWLRETQKYTTYKIEEVNIKQIQKMNITSKSTVLIFIRRVRGNRKQCLTRRKWKIGWESNGNIVVLYVSCVCIVALFSTLSHTASEQRRWWCTMRDVRGAMTKNHLTSKSPLRVKKSSSRKEKFEKNVHSFWCGAVCGMVRDVVVCCVW